MKLKRLRRGVPKESTNIQVSLDTWKELNFRKQPGESFDDVVQRMIRKAEAFDEADLELEDTEE